MSVGPSVSVRTAGLLRIRGGPDTVDCCREAAGRVHQRSVWLGPAGTRTPLHRDPYFNLLCQAWGAKAVRLHAPEHAAALAPYHQHALRNTSQARWQWAHATAS